MTHLARYIALGWAIWAVTSVTDTVGTSTGASTFGAWDAVQVLFVLGVSFVVGWCAAKENKHY